MIDISTLRRTLFPFRWWEALLIAAVIPVSNVLLFQEYRVSHIVLSTVLGYVAGAMGYSRRLRNQERKRAKSH